MKCTNNLKQLALAEHNHADAHKVFSPASHDIRFKQALNNGNDYQRISYLCGLLPFIEQTALYNQIAPFHLAGGRPWWFGDATANSVTYVSPYKTNVPTFRCPSDSIQLNPDDVPPTNYVCNRVATFT